MPGTNGNPRGDESMRDIQLTLARHDEQIKTSGKEIERLQELYDLKQVIAELKMQIKITWALLIMVIGGMVAQAMATWGGKP